MNNLKTFILSNYDYKIIDIDSFSISIKITYSKIESWIGNPFLDKITPNKKLL